MVKTLKASLTAIMLSSVAAVPVATVAYFATSDATFAKSENSRGGERGKSEEAKSRAKEKSGHRSQAKERSNGKQKVSKAKDGPKAVESEEGVIVFHPSELGNMNGAMNANINAVLAHIRNGNGNGPVGHLAVLAVMTSKAEGQQDVVDTELAYQELERLLSDGGFASIDEYYDYRNGIDPITSIDDAKAVLDGYAEGTPEYDDALIDLNDALGDNFASYEEYEAARSGFKDTEGFDDSIDLAISGLGGSSDSEDGFDDFSESRPTSDEYNYAVDALEAEDAAEEDILAYWNKNPGGDTPEGEDHTEEEKQLLADLKSRFDGNEGAIESAISDSETYADECDPETATCDG